MAEELHIVNARMLQIMKFCVENNVVNTQSEWCDIVGVNQFNMTKYRTNERIFTVGQIYLAAKEFNISTDYIFGLNDKMFRPKSRIL